MKTSIISSLILVAIFVAGCGKKQTGPSAFGQSSKTNVVRFSSKTNYSGLFTESDAISLMRKQVDISQVVAFGIVDTNSFPEFVVTVSEIWKGQSAAFKLGVTNGTQFTARWSPAPGVSMPNGKFPEGAVVLIKKDEIPSDFTRRRAVLYVWNGQMFGMPIEQYKATVGL